MSTNPARKLKVIAGVHKNAELIIEENMDYLIGRGDECDIVLMDKGVAKEHLSLCHVDGKVCLKSIKTGVYVDGKLPDDETMTINDFQVVTLGEAHFAIGPADTQWPLIIPPIIKLKPEQTGAGTLLPVCIPDTQENRWQTEILLYFKGFYEFIRSTNKKILATTLMFALLFLSFWMDFILSGTTAKADESTMASTGELSGRNRNSLILSFIKVMAQVREETLVGAGMEEPPVNVEKEVVVNPESTQVIRDILKQEWGGNLTETRKGDGEIEFRGYDSVNQMDLQLSLKKETDGTLSAEGYTLRKKQRKEIMAELGDIIRTKVIAADDVENLCHRTLQKKQIKQPQVQFDMEKKAVTLTGESDNHHIISEIEKIISHSLPDIKITNQVRYKPENFDIVGLSISGVAHVKLGDGSKIFPGGKLRNGCTVVKIHENSILLNCNGTTVSHQIGENP